jgi:hypothetical protein
MKKFRLLLFISSLLFTNLLLNSCSKDDDDPEVTTIEHISGTQSSYGNVGASAYVAAGAVEGVGAISGTVTENVNGVSTINLSGTVTDEFLLTLVANVGGFTVDGNLVTTPTLKIKATSEGFESIQGFDPGILIKFDCAEGDTYHTSWGNVRTVTHKSTTDDYPWNGMNIKVIKVEEPKTSNKDAKTSSGVTKIIYYANHNWGIVGVEFVFATGSSIKFPVRLTGAKK